MNIPETLYRLRTARGMSQEALADALGVSRQAVSKWETGAAVPDVDKIVQLSDFYGVTTDEILKGGAAATQQDGSPEAQPAGDGDDGQAEAGAEDAAGDAVPGDGQEASGAARFAAAAAQAVPSASAVFLRVWPAFCAIVCIASGIICFTVWLYSQFVYLISTPFVLPVLGAMATLSGLFLFEFGALFVPALRLRRAGFYPRAIWGLALLPCCLVSEIADFVFSNWLTWRLESWIGWGGALLVSLCAKYLIPVIVYGGICTCVSDSFTSE